MSEKYRMMWSPLVFPVAEKFVPLGSRPVSSEKTAYALTAVPCCVWCKPDAVSQRRPWSGAKRCLAAVPVDAAHRDDRDAELCADLLVRSGQVLDEWAPRELPRREQHRLPAGGSDCRMEVAHSLVEVALVVDRLELLSLKHEHFELLR
eukprot:6051665-Prymnesium_polylepis.1